MNAHTEIAPVDLIAEQRRIDRWSLEQAREGLAKARSKRVQPTITMYRNSVVRLYLRIRRQRRPA